MPPNTRQVRIPQPSSTARSQGTEFYQFHVNAPVCSPSRAALYTGQFPGRNKVFWIYENARENRKYGLNDWLDPELVLLPRLMKQAGYLTGHYGKWHLGDVQSSPALEQYGIDDGRCWCGPPPSTWGHDTVYKETMDFIRRHQDVPFFMNLWIRETHTPHWLHNETLDLPWIKALPEDERVYAAVAWGNALLTGILMKSSSGLQPRSPRGPEAVSRDQWPKPRVFSRRVLGPRLS